MNRERLMIEDDLIELNEDFENRIALCMDRWRESRIETRGITSGRDAGTVSKVSGYINTGKAADRFGEVVNGPGIEWTVELVFVDDRYRPITRRWTMALSTAKGRVQSFLPPN